jgi:hypothetical protein
MPSAKSKTIKLEAGAGAATLTLSWHNTQPGGIPGMGHITASTVLRPTQGNPATHVWVIPGVPVGGWPLTMAHCVVLRQALTEELPNPRIPFLGPFGVRVENKITGPLKMFMQNNATSRRTNVTYQRKSLRDRFGSPAIMSTDDNVVSFHPFVLVWERPLRGGDDAAARGLVKAKGGKPVLEDILAHVNGRSITHTLSAQDIAERLLNIESTVLNLGVRSEMLDTTEVIINPQLPTANAFWSKSKSGVGYTSVTLLRLKAGTWALVTANRLIAKAPVRTTMLLLSMAASVASLTGHMKARGINLKHENSWRLMSMLSEWREWQEVKRRKLSPVAAPTINEIPNPGVVDDDPIYRRLIGELVELIQQDDTIMQDVEALRGTPQTVEF